MKSILLNLQQLNEGSSTDNIYISTGTRRYDFHCTGGDVFWVRQHKSGLTSPNFKVNLTGIRRAMDWIDQEDTALIRRELAA